MAWVTRRSFKKKPPPTKLYAAKLLRNYHSSLLDIPKGTVLDVILQCKTADGVYCRVNYPGDTKVWIPSRDLRGV